MAIVKRNLRRNSSPSNQEIVAMAQRAMVACNPEVDELAVCSLWSEQQMILLAAINRGDWEEGHKAQRYMLTLAYRGIRRNEKLRKLLINYTATHYAYLLGKEDVAAGR